MDPEPLTAELRAALREVLRRARLPLAEASRQLAHDRNYLARVLSGRYRLKIREVFEILALVQMNPWHFFHLYFPLAGTGMVRLRGDEQTNPAGMAELAARTRHMARLYEDLGAYTPWDWTERVSLVLRDLIRARGTTQKAVSLGLGLGPTAFGQALRGASQLTAAHVLGALAILGASPGRFFWEVLFPGDNLAAGITWSRMLDEIVKDLEPGATEAADRKAAALEPAPPGADEKGED